MTTQEFIEKSKTIHGDKYDYSKSVFVSYDEKVIVICPKHGEFMVSPNNHLHHKQRCPKCSREKNTCTTEEFIEKARKVHSNKYDYSKVEYKTSKTKVCIICPEHGEFWQIPNNHLNGANCPRCGRNKANDSTSFDTEEFIRRAQKTHGDKFDYSKVNYVRSTIPVTIICKTCGKEFKQKPAMHIQGNGCPHCNPPHKKSNTEEFKAKLAITHPNLELLSEYEGNMKPITVRCKIHNNVYETTPKRLIDGANCQKCYDDRRGDKTKNPLDKIRQEIYEVHGNRYQYPKLEEEYKSNKSKITIICPIHGEFKQSYNSHINKGSGCPKCADELNGFNKRLTTEEFIEKARKVHGDKYDYSKVIYETTSTPIEIICSTHGSFWQRPDGHLQGAGCPKCSMSHLEESIELILKENNIDYTWQKRFPFLHKKSLDFYIKNKKVAIECQGSQHFYPVEQFGGQDAFEQSLVRDSSKYFSTTENKIKMLYIISNKDKDCINNSKFFNIYNNENTLFIEDIMNEPNLLLERLK